MNARRFDVTGLSQHDFTSALLLALQIAGKPCVSVVVTRNENPPRLIVYNRYIENSLPVKSSSLEPGGHRLIAAAGKWLSEHGTLSTEKKIGWRVYLPSVQAKTPSTDEDRSDETIPHRDYAICVISPIAFDTLSSVR